MNNTPLQNIFTLKDETFDSSGKVKGYELIEGCRIVVSEDASEWLQAQSSISGEQVQKLLDSPVCEDDCALDVTKTYYQYNCQATSNPKTSHWSATYFVDNGEQNNDGDKLPW